MNMDLFDRKTPEKAKNRQQKNNRFRSDSTIDISKIDNIDILRFKYDRGDREFLFLSLWLQ